MLITPVSVASSHFCFGCTDTLQTLQHWSKPGPAVRLAVRGDLHIRVNSLDLKSWGNSILQRMFSYCSHLIWTHASIPALLQRGTWHKIKVCIQEMGLCNCCSFDLAFGSELECRAVWRQHLHPVALFQFMCCVGRLNMSFADFCRSWLQSKFNHRHLWQSVVN